MRLFRNIWQRINARRVAKKQIQNGDTMKALAGLYDAFGKDGRRIHEQLMDQTWS